MKARILLYHVGGVVDHQFDISVDWIYVHLLLSAKYMQQNIQYNTTRLQDKEVESINIAAQPKFHAVQIIVTTQIIPLNQNNVTH
jgi:hypothetical protein